MYIGPSGITKVEDKKGRLAACPFLCFDCSDRDFSHYLVRRVAFAKGDTFTVILPTSS